jgi:EpsI family protein
VWLVGGLIAVAIMAYWPTSMALWSVLPLGGGQGFLVLALALWLLARARERVAVAPVRPMRWAILPLLACSVAALIFWKAGIQTLHLVLLPMLILLAVLAAFGPAVARAVAVPIGFLYFALPAWNLLAVPLQNLTLRVVSLLSHPLGMPATVAGSLVTFPGGATFQVTPLCSGVGFLVQGLAVAVLLGELEHASMGRRLRLAGSMALVALAANWIRVLVTMQIGYKSGMRNVLATRGHLLLGSLLFILVLALFVWAATRRPLPPKRAPMSTTATEQRRLLPGYLMSLAALTAAPLLVNLLAPPRDVQAAGSELRLPAGRANWRGPTDISDGTWKPEFVGSHASWQVAYSDVSGHDVEVVAIGYTSQEQGRELVNEGNSLLGESGLRALTAQLVEFDGQPYVEQLVVDAQGHQSIIWSAYNIGGRSFTAPLLSQLWYGVRSLRGAPYSVLFAFRSECESESACAAARATLQTFVRGMGAELAAAVAQASRSERSTGPA